MSGEISRGGAFLFASSTSPFAFGGGCGNGEQNDRKCEEGHNRRINQSGFIEAGLVRVGGGVFRAIARAQRKPIPI